MKNANGNIDVLVINDDSNMSAYSNKDIELCIFEKNNFKKIGQLKSVRSVVSCGMEEQDSVTFSSISEDCALVCIRRQIIFYDRVIYPCEFKSSYRSELGIYKNLSNALVEFLFDDKKQTELRYDNKHDRQKSKYKCL